MTWTNWRYWAFAFLIFGSIQFIILTFIAMFFYQGGTYHNPSTLHYTFWFNYFSDLGRFYAHSGVKNTVSFILFTIALAIWGFSHVPFYIAFTKFFVLSIKTKIISIIGSLFGVLTGVYYIGIAFTPSDLLYDLHDFFVFLGFRSIFISMIIFSIIIYKDKEFPKLYANILIISSIILGIYFLTLFSIQDINFTIRLFISAIGQKIMIYTLLFCCIIQGYGALKHLKLRLKSSLSF